MVTAQQITNQRRALAASQAQQARFKREAARLSELQAVAPELLEGLVYLHDCVQNNLWPHGDKWQKASILVQKFGVKS